MLFGPNSEADLSFLGKFEKEHGGRQNLMFVPACERVFHADWVEAPDKFKTLQVVCEGVLDYGGSLDEMPRVVARRQVEQLREMGFLLKSAFEFEYLVLNSETHKPEFERMDYGGLATMNQYASWLYPLDSHLVKNGIAVRTMHSEIAQGQLEYSFIPQEGIDTADNTYIFKQAIKEVGRQHGKLVSFMPLVFNEGDINGAHFNHSLVSVKGREKVFWSEVDEKKMSEVCRWWLGGLLKHQQALTALSCPTVNCYRRLHRPFAPGKVEWGVDNRFLALRLMNKDPATMRIEFRLPSSACNAYLVIAGVIAAGIDGIKNRIEPTPEGSNPDAPSLPHSLDEALQALSGDQVLSAALGRSFVEWYCRFKRTIDLKHLAGHDMKKCIKEELEAEKRMYLKTM